MAALPEQCTVQVTQQGGVTVFIASTPGGTGVTGVAASAPITVDNTNPTAPIIGISNTTVVPGSYTNADITVDAKGRITAASNGVITGAFTDPGIAYISSDGNDGTGTGSPDNPFLTFQGAINHASVFTRFSFGEGSFGNATFNARNSAVEFSILSRGGWAIIGTITNNNDVTMRASGYFTIAAIVTSPGAVPSGATGNAGFLVALLADSTVSVLSATAPGGTGGVGTGILVGGDGGVGGNVRVQGTMNVQSIVVSGGAGGNSGGAGAGSPGAPGLVTLKCCPNVSALTPDAATVQGAVINNVFYDNTYP